MLKFKKNSGLNFKSYWTPVRNTIITVEYYHSVIFTAPNAGT